MLVVHVSALDYYGFWKLFDGLTDAAFYMENSEYALGNTPQQRYGQMERWQNCARTTNSQFIKLDWHRCSVLSFPIFPASITTSIHPKLLHNSIKHILGRIYLVIHVNGYQ